MAKKEILDKLSIYIPQSKMDKKPVERLIALGEKRDRQATNLSSRQPYLVVEAILEYLERETDSVVDHLWSACSLGVRAAQQCAWSSEG